MFFAMRGSMENIADVDSPFSPVHINGSNEGYHCTSIHMNNISLKTNIPSLCFFGYTIHKQRCERISDIWIQDLMEKKRRGYKCEQ